MLGRTLFVFGSACSFTCATQRAFLLNAAAFRFIGVPRVLAESVHFAAAGCGRQSALRA